MLHRDTIKSLLREGLTRVGQTITISGWVGTKRDSKAGLSFIDLFDGSSFKPLQVIAKKSLDTYESEVLKLTTHCAVTITGQIIESPAKGQDIELLADKVTVHGWVEDPLTYPIQPKEHSMDYLRSQAHLRPRSKRFGSIFRIRNALAAATHSFFQGLGFQWVHTPIITGEDCEGAGEMFKLSSLEFFGREVGLTVSGQLSVETFCQAFSRVYTFGPTFRAENSHTSRHLSEFWMIEPEIAFSELADDIELAEAYVKYMASELLKPDHEDDLAYLSKVHEIDLFERLRVLAEEGFVRMSYTDAIKVLQDSGQKFEFEPEWGIDLQSEHEKFLCSSVGERAVIVHDYPKDIKAFYMRLNDDQKTVAAMDVLVPGAGELIGGSQREERLDVLTERMIQSGLDPEEYWWYLDLRRYGTVPHAGFGLGFERMVQYATGTANIRDVIPFPRAPGSIEF